MNPALASQLAALLQNIQQPPQALPPQAAGFPGGLGLGGGGGGIIGQEALGNPLLGGLFPPVPPLAQASFQTPQALPPQPGGVGPALAQQLASELSGATAAPPQPVPPTAQPPAAQPPGPAAQPPQPVPPVGGGGEGQFLGPPVSGGGPAPSALPPEALPFVTALAQGLQVPGHPFLGPPIGAGGGGPFLGPPVGIGGQPTDVGNPLLGPPVSVGGGTASSPPLDDDEERRRRQGGSRRRRGEPIRRSRGNPGAQRRGGGGRSRVNPRAEPRRPRSNAGGGLEARRLRGLF